MKTRYIALILLSFSILSACQRTDSPAEVAATVDMEFNLAPDQSAVVRDTGLTITLDSVVGDDRCPSEVECVASGPVEVSLSVQKGNETPADFTLQTFTDQNGRSPNLAFEGITNQVEVAGYLIRIVAVTPYPQNPEVKMDPSDYHVTLLVSNK
jgi:hypothetical protein